MFNSDAVPMKAMIRKLASFSHLKLFVDDEDHEGKKILAKVSKSLSDEKKLCDSKIHPLSILTALTVYQRGTRQGPIFKEWLVHKDIVNALENAFSATIQVLDYLIFLLFVYCCTATAFFEKHSIEMAHLKLLWLYQLMVSCIIFTYSVALHKP